VPAPKYFHEVWPQRKTALAPPARPAKTNSVSSKATGSEQSST
jgi:hypothetical protein